jgi:hypothetical protein
MVFEMLSRVPEAIFSQFVAKKAKSIALYGGLLDMVMLRLDTKAGLLLSSRCHVCSCSWMSSTSTTRDTCTGYNATQTDGYILGTVWLVPCACPPIRMFSFRINSGFNSEEWCSLFAQGIMPPAICSSCDQVLK